MRRTHFNQRLPMCSGLWILQSKILRPELRDALCFMRRYAPLKHEPCVSHAAIVPCTSCTPLQYWLEAGLMRHVVTHQ